MVYFALSALATATLCYMIAITLQIEDSPENIKRFRLIGGLLSIVISVTLASLVLRKKRRFSGKGIGMVIITFFLAAIIGGFASMALVAYLTTWEPVDDATEKPEGQ